MGGVGDDDGEILFAFGVFVGVAEALSLIAVLGCESTSAGADSPVVAGLQDEDSDCSLIELRSGMAIVPPLRHLSLAVRSSSAAVVLAAMVESDTMDYDLLPVGDGVCAAALSGDAATVLRCVLPLDGPLEDPSSAALDASLPNELVLQLAEAVIWEAFGDRLNLHMFVSAALHPFRQLHSLLPSSTEESPPFEGHGDSGEYSAAASAGDRYSIGQKG